MLKKPRKRELNTEDAGQQFRVYRNLHRRVWSLQQGAKVIAHSSWVLLNGVTFTVSERGRARALRRGVRNVHAKAQGTLLAGDGVQSVAYWLITNMREVTYNPFKAAGFYFRDTGEVVSAADLVLFATDGKAWVLYY